MLDYQIQYLALVGYPASTKAENPLSGLKPMPDTQLPNKGVRTSGKFNIRSNYKNCNHILSVRKTTYPPERLMRGHQDEESRMIKNFLDNPFDLELVAVIK